MYSIHNNGYNNVYSIVRNSLYARDSFVIPSIHITKQSSKFTAELELIPAGCINVLPAVKRRNRLERQPTPSLRPRGTHLKHMRLREFCCTKLRPFGAIWR